MPPEDQVETPVESSDAGALGGEQDTQGDAAASSDTGTTTEAAEPTVEEQLATLTEKTAKLETDLEESREGFRQQQSRADTAEAELAPIRAARQKELEAITKDEERFQKRVDEVGFVQAQNELVDARFALHAQQQEVQRAAAESTKSWDQATADTWAYAKKQGLTEDQLELLKSKHGYFPAPSPEHSVRLAKLAINEAVGKQVTAEAQEKMARTAEEDVRRKVVNQPPAGGAGPGTQVQTSTEPGQATMDGMAEAAKTITTDDL
ncbi:MAG: hypothetical protein ACYTBZ_31165 [Planctomycetota bacterium]|jgi:hypothetical protein